MDAYHRTFAPWDRNQSRRSEVNETAGDSDGFVFEVLKKTHQFDRFEAGKPNNLPGGCVATEIASQEAGSTDELRMSPLSHNITLIHQEDSFQEGHGRTELFTRGFHRNFFMQGNWL